MKFECMTCGKIISSLDAREGEAVISVQQGGFGQIHGWRIECEECHNQRKKQDKEDEEAK
jgi:hypothetical protein